jgi:hypothetical protein
MFTGESASVMVPPIILLIGMGAMEQSAKEPEWYAWITQEEDGRWSLISSGYGLLDQTPFISRNRDMAEALARVAQRHGVINRQPVRLVWLKPCGDPIATYDP